MNCICEEGTNNNNNYQEREQSYLAPTLARDLQLISNEGESKTHR